MRARRCEIEQSLAERGRPAMWANEQEAALLSGVGMDAFRRKVKEWEARGFPCIHPENGKRPIPAIYAFFGLPQGHWHSPPPPVLTLMDDDDEDGRENWSGR